MRTPLLRRSPCSFRGVNVLLIMSMVALLPYVFDSGSPPLKTDLAVAPKTATIGPQSGTPASLRGSAQSAEAPGVIVRIEAEPKIRTPSIQTITLLDPVRNKNRAEMTALQSAPGDEGKTSDSKKTENTLSAGPDAAPLRGSTDAVLDAEDVQRFIDRATHFFEVGDVASARLLLNRAAKARNPTAVLALGSTFDPAVLKQRGVVGITADLEKARSWYEVARKLGSQNVRSD